MIKLRYILIGCLLLAGAHGAKAQDALPENVVQEEMAEVEQELDVKKLVFDHIGDSYGWHITTLGDREISVPLPIILKSKERGWHFFNSSKLEHGAEHRGFYISKAGEHEGKIVERDSTGKEVRPLDLSLTKTAFALLLNSLILILIIVGVARWYKKRKVEDSAPGGFVGMMEMLIMSIYDDLIKPSVGKDYQRFAPYLLTVFFFIFLNNIMGLIPIFPGGANVTGNIAITLVLAFCTFLAVNLFGKRDYWKEVFWPEVPTWLKAPIPMMPAIEFVGIFTKPFALMIRLFANMMAGHAVILSLTCLVFVTVAMGAAVNGTMTVVSVLFTIFMNVLEILVAFIQAYVFTMLSAVFIGLARADHHPKKEEEQPKEAPQA